MEIFYPKQIVICVYVMANNTIIFLFVKRSVEIQSDTSHAVKHSTWVYPREKKQKNQKIGKKRSFEAFKKKWTVLDFQLI